MPKKLAITNLVLNRNLQVLCSTMVTETIQYYTNNRGSPVYLLLLDATKAYDKVSFKVLFDVLLDKNVCPRIVNLLYYMFTNQQAWVRIRIRIRIRRIRIPFGENSNPDSNPLLI